MIYSIALKEDWDKAKATGLYQTASLDTEGFIHCSTLEQLMNVANKHFKGKIGLTLLTIDEKKLSAKVIYENPDKNGKTFPHIYGKINIDAIIKEAPFLPNNDGLFS